MHSFYLKNKIRGKLTKKYIFLIKCYQNNFDWDKRVIENIYIYKRQ